MLPIEGPHIKIAAEWWADVVIDFLNSLRKCDIRRHNDADGVILRTRMEHYEEFFKGLCNNKEIEEHVTSSSWDHIRNFLSEKSNLMGSKLMDDGWRNTVVLDLRNSNLKEVVVATFKKIYGEVINEFGYELILKLKIRTCPYCNRNYTVTVRKRNRRNGENSKFCTRPEFDHFFSQGDYPFFAITFFNLVPSCKECNHGKLKKEAKINPYFGKLSVPFRLIRNKHQREKNPRDDDRLNANEVYGLNKEGSFDVAFHKPSDDEKKNIETFGLRERYNQHKDYVMEIVEKAAAYNKLARTEIVDSFQGIFHSEADIYNLIFGKYLSDAEQPKRPLSKLTADILEQLEIRQAHTLTSLSSNHRKIIDIQNKLI